MDVDVDDGDMNDLALSLTSGFERLISQLSSSTSSEWRCDIEVDRADVTSFSALVVVEMT